MRGRYNIAPDKNHHIPRDYLRDRCGGFESRKSANTVAYTGNYRGFRILLIDVSKYGGVLTDWLIQCLDNNRFFWIECKTPEAYRMKDHDKTDGETWLAERANNFRFCVEDADIEGILYELTYRD